MLLFLSALGACAGRTSTSDAPDAEMRNRAQDKPPVSEQSIPLRQPNSPYRTVVHGDTLYSIAWETGQDYRVLAIWNHINPPYTIKPGQELRILPPAVEKPTAPAAPKFASVKEKDKAAVASKSINKKATPITPLPPVKPATASSATKKIKKEVRAKTTIKPAKTPASGKPAAIAGLWMWPADGQLLKRYSDNDAAKGLDIGGARGQPVRATTSGRVVYQGSGLRGYGQLIIIKHSDEYLSAYAHNDRIYVKEGDVVKRGQKIADMGSTGTDRVKLHFEIRRQGAPIDPLKFLPKR